MCTGNRADSQSLSKCAGKFIGLASQVSQYWLYLLCLIKLAVLDEMRLSLTIHHLGAGLGLYHGLYSGWGGESGRYVQYIKR